MAKLLVKIWVCLVWGFGGYFESASGVYAYVGGWSYAAPNWVNYKIMGTGTVSTIVKDLNNNKVTMFCPEAPEVLFQDKGEGQLVNGYTHIDLDAIFAKNVLIDATHPLSVLIQPEGDCQGTYVTNKTAQGFDVKELNNGKSSAKFTWFVIATRADETYTDKEGNSRLSSYSKVRFPANNAEVKTTKVDVINRSTQLNK